ncbi:MAG: hypothetical protein HC884_08740 [Chloroflexaceae bacterium]|nr:hypothetical protein [Chloroflexaceae bacterium]
MDQVYMDVPAVRDMAKNFQTISEVLKAVDKALEAITAFLKATAFIGLVGGTAVIQFIEMLRPHIQDKADKCEELSQDLDASVDAFERGDQQGATKFY